MPLARATLARGALVDGPSRRRAPLVPCSSPRYVRPSLRPCALGTAALRALMVPALTRARRAADHPRVSPTITRAKLRLPRADDLSQVTSIQADRMRDIFDEIVRGAKAFLIAECVLPAADARTGWAVCVCGGEVGVSRPLCPR